MNYVNGNEESHPNIEYASPSFDVRVEPPIAIVRFSKGRRRNAFSSSRIQALDSIIIKELNNNAEVTCFVLTGGDGISFSTGRDFHKTMSFTGGKEIDDWIDTFTNLYSTILGIPKPVIAAIDGHAVGLGV
jgi:carboxymethylproline synthase